MGRGSQLQLSSWSTEICLDLIFTSYLFKCYKRTEIFPSELAYIIRQDSGSLPGSGGGWIGAEVRVGCPMHTHTWMHTHVNLYYTRHNYM